MLKPLIEEVGRRLGDVIYDIRTDDAGSLALSAVNALKVRQWTVSTCESLTGGLIAASLVEIPGASSVFRGGFVTYQTDTKTLLADVPADLIEIHGVVSAEVAAAMAEGTRRRLGTDVAVSATGLAGPDGGTEEKPVGTVFVGIATEKGVRTLHLRLHGNRDRIRTVTMKHAVNAIRLEAAQ